MVPFLIVFIITVTYIILNVGNEDITRSSDPWYIQKINQQNAEIEKLRYERKNIHNTCMDNLSTCETLYHQCEQQLVECKTEMDSLMTF